MKLCVCCGKEIPLELGKNSRYCSKECRLKVNSSAGLYAAYRENGDVISIEVLGTIKKIKYGQEILKFKRTGRAALVDKMIADNSFVAPPVLPEGENKEPRVDTA
jgi:hypothetical protein